MMKRRGFLAAFVGFALFLPAMSAGAATDEFSDGAHKFVRSLADKAISSLTGTSISGYQRKKNFRDLFRAHFDIDTIGKRVLGRHWRKTSASERKEFLGLFEDFIVNTYVKRFRKYTNESLSISGASSRNRRTAIVHSHIVRGGGVPSIRVDWRVSFPDGHYKVVDLVVEGVSMVQTQRAEFSSVIRRGGGKVMDLITALRDKNTQLEAEKN